LTTITTGASTARSNHTRKAAAIVTTTSLSHTHTNTKTVIARTCRFTRISKTWTAAAWESEGNFSLRAFGWMERRRRQSVRHQSRMWVLWKCGRRIGMRRIILESLRLNAGLVAAMKYENYQDTVAPIANT